LTDEAAIEARNDHTTGLANPLATAPPTDPEDRTLVLRARVGDREAVEHLVYCYQAWIYNLAVRMLYRSEQRGRCPCRYRRRDLDARIVAHQPSCGICCRTP
jgi:hypothetical protein